MIQLFYEGWLLRITGAAVVSFLIVLIAGPRMIRYLIIRKIGDRPEFDHADLNRLTRHKSMTPTMGGIIIVIARESWMNLLNWGGIRGALWL